MRTCLAVNERGAHGRRRCVYGPSAYSPKFLTKTLHRCEISGRSIAFRKFLLNFVHAQCFAEKKSSDAAQERLRLGLRLGLVLG